MTASALVVLALLSGEPSSAPTSPEGRWSFTSQRAVVPADLEKLTPWELRVMRNELFARHGYTFKNELLELHFLDQRWHRPQHANVDDRLTALEKQNIATLKAAEPAAAKAALETLDPKFRDFYERFRRALATRKPAAVAKLIHFPLKHSVGPTLLPPRVSRETFAGGFEELFPANAIEFLQLEVPRRERDGYTLSTPRVRRYATHGWEYTFVEADGVWGLASVHTLASAG